jgi:HEAT repeat protein
MPRNDILGLLRGGDRRSDEVAAMVSADPRLFPKLIAGLWSENSLVRMRAADAAEKVTRMRSDLLHKKELLGLLQETSQQELRWHPAARIPRMSLSPAELQRAVSSLTIYLEDRSSIVQTFAIQGLADLAQHAQAFDLQ